MRLVQLGFKFQQKIGKNYFSSFLCMPLPRAQNDKNGFWHPQPTHLAHHTYTAGAFPLHNLQFRAEIHHALLSQFSFLVKLLFCKQSECVVCSFVLFWCPYETSNFGKVMKRQKPSKWVEVDRFQGLLHLRILRMYVTTLPIL